MILSVRLRWTAEYWNQYHPTQHNIIQHNITWSKNEITYTIFITGGLHKNYHIVSATSAKPSTDCILFVFFIKPNLPYWNRYTVMVMQTEIRHYVLKLFCRLEASGMEMRKCGIYLQFGYHIITWVNNGRQGIMKEIVIFGASSVGMEIVSNCSTDCRIISSIVSPSWFPSSSLFKPLQASSSAFYGDNGNNSQTCLRSSD